MRGLAPFLSVFLIVQSVAVATIGNTGQTVTQTSSQQSARIEKVKASVQKRSIGEKSRVKVTLHNKSEQTGYISQIAEESFSVTDKKTGQVQTVSYADVEQIHGSGLSKGAKIGIAVGVGVAVVAIALAIALRDPLKGLHF